MDALTKALQQTSGNGANLMPYVLEPAINEMLERLSPLWSLIPKSQAEGKTHEYTQRTSVPGAWFEGELTTPAPLASGYTRKSVQLKILRISGGVSGFLQATSAKFINALDQEIQGSVQGLANLFEWAAFYGNATADPYQFDGLAAFSEKDTTGKKAMSAGGSFYDVNGVVALSNLDAMIDAKNSYRQAVNDRYAFLMSNQMISKISGLQTRVSRSVTTMELDGGFRFNAYRDIPLIPTASLTPAATSSSPTLTATIAAGGSLATNAWYYSIASVTANGEQVCSAEATCTSATTNNKANLTWTADPAALQYKIYRSATTGVANHRLLATIAAKTYDSEGAVNGTVAAYSDDGTVTPNAAIPALTAAAEEQVVLMNLDAQRGMNLLGMLSPLGERTDNFVSYIPLATRKSAYEYMIETFMAGLVKYPELNIIARRVKTA